jgi:hypothetical protein
MYQGKLILRRNRGQNLGSHVNRGANIGTTEIEQNGRQIQ